MDEFIKVTNANLFHDQNLLDIRKENGDVIIEVDDDVDNKYIIRIVNAKIKSNVEIDLNDLKNAWINELSYNESDNGEKCIFLKTVSNNGYFLNEFQWVSFYNEFYFYSDNIVVSAK